MKGGSKISGEITKTIAKAKRVPGNRPRSVPHKRSFVQAVILSAAHYMGIIAALTTLVVFFLQPTHLATRVLMLCIVFIGVAWLLAFFKRRSTYCPLCKGTPLINSGALTHEKATRIWPFNHGVSAILSIIVTHQFRCMYCGTLYDLLKIPSHLAESEDLKRGDNYTPEDPS